MVEQRPFKPLVGGSSPPAPTRFLSPFFIINLIWTAARFNGLSVFHHSLNTA